MLSVCLDVSTDTLVNASDYVLSMLMTGKSSDSICFLLGFCFSEL